MNQTKVFSMAFSRIYPLYIQKVERKGRTKSEVDAVVCWLTGYDEGALHRQIEGNVDLTTFFAEAPQMNSNVSKIKGVVCGYRVENIDDPLMQKIRFMDKLIDDLAKGKTLEKILFLTDK